MPPASAAATSGWSSYFGETYTKDDCGACDYCLGELETVADPVTLARKILSCVARVGQRFGAAHVANVLRGHASEQVQTARPRHALGVRAAARQRRSTRCAATSIS